MANFGLILHDPRHCIRHHGSLSHRHEKGSPENILGSSFLAAEGTIGAGDKWSRAPTPTILPTLSVIYTISLSPLQSLLLLLLILCFSSFVKNFQNVKE